jgi:hemerythrin-like metal-binding protein
MYESKENGRNTYTFSKVQAHLDSNSHNWIALDKTHLFGIPEIDQEHQYLANILNQLNTAVRSSEPAEVTAQLINILVEQIRSHFENEDRLMDKFGYADNDIHKNEHKRLIAELGYLKDKFNQGGEMVVLYSLKEWLLNHIANSDKLLGDFILQHRVK